MIDPAPAGGRDRESGFSLVVVLATALMLATLAMAATLRVRDLAADGSRDRSALDAVYAAHGGVEAARAALARDPAWSGGVIRVGRGEARVVVEAPVGDPALRSVVVLAACPGTGGTSIGARTRVEALLALRPGGLPEVRSWK